VRLVLDAGALVAIDRGVSLVGAILARARRQGHPLMTSAAVVAQVWRHGPRQAILAHILAGVESVPLDLPIGKQIGSLLGQTHTLDVVDAHVARLVSDGDHVLTSDPGDIALLLDARRVKAVVTRV
jgi:hypothetical protein